MKKTLIINPQMNNSLDEAQPVGALSRAGNWLKSQLPTFAPGSAASARGAKPTANKANTMKLQYQEWLGSIGESPTQENLLSWLKSNNFPTNAADNIFATPAVTPSAAATPAVTPSAAPVTPAVTPSAAPKITAKTKATPAVTPSAAPKITAKTKATPGAAPGTAPKITAKTKATPGAAPKITAKKRATESESEKMRRFISLLKEDTAIDDKLVNQVILAVARDMARSGTAPTATPQSTTAFTPSNTQSATQTYSPSASQSVGSGNYPGGSQSDQQDAPATMSATQLITTIKNMKTDEKRAFFTLLLANPSYKKYIEKMLGNGRAPVSPTPPTTKP